jgi:hypothetical protein
VKRFSSVLGIMTLLMIITLSAQAPLRTVSSETFSCPEIVLQAFDAADQVCSDTSRNQACYGHMQLDVRSQPDVETFEFSSEGDRVDVADVKTLRLSAMDVDQGVWGVALLRVQASLPDTQPNRNLTMVLFGEVTIENAGTLAPSLNVTVTSHGNVNMRSAPTTAAQIVDSIKAGSTVEATGRLEDVSWLHVRHPETGKTGWIYGQLATSAGDITSLDVVEPTSVSYEPMQAFYFESGMHDSACPEAPDSGLLIQTPEGVGQVTLLINEVDIQLGSTVYFQAQPGAEMIVSVVEGSARVESAGVVHTAAAGTQISVPMDADMRPAGPPSEPRPYDQAALMALPLRLLERTVSIHPPLTPKEALAFDAGPVYEETVVEPVEPNEPAETVQEPQASEGEVPPSPVTEEQPPEEKITICHKGNTITISPSAWPAHEAHGDTLGPCP